MLLLSTAVIYNRAPPFQERNCATGIPYSRNNLTDSEQNKINKYQKKYFKERPLYAKMLDKVCRLCIFPKSEDAEGSIEEKPIGKSAEEVQNLVNKIFGIDVRTRDSSQTLSFFHFCLPFPAAFRSF